LASLVFEDVPSPGATKLWELDGTARVTSATLAGEEFRCHRRAATKLWELDGTARVTSATLAGEEFQGQPAGGCLLGDALQLLAGFALFQDAALAT
jgi:hypothetical protein